MSRAAFYLGGFVSLLAFLAGPSMAQEDQMLSDALSLVKASLECPAERYTPSDAPFDHRLDRGAFIGNSTTFVASTSRDHLLTWPGSRPDQWHDSVQSSMAYSAIGSIQTIDLTVRISCAQNSQCVQLHVDRPKYSSFSSSEDHIDIRVCDMPTAENLKTALDYLKSRQK
jgi:hypothetical protein